MCGIAGLFNFHAVVGDPRQRAELVRRMAGTMAHRGPDADGYWSDPRGRCEFGHRRLSIIDISEAGRQPMANIDGRCVLTFNGELYNFLELRPQLEAEGARFKGRTDTEVLIQGLALWGVDALPRFDGMFALAAFDTVSGELLLARDAFGEKPLYYMEFPDGAVAFASELQALEQLPGFDGEVSLDAMAEMLMFQYIGAPRTIYSRVKKLPPGHWLRARPGATPQIGRYFAFHPGLGEVDRRSIPDLADELEDILVRSLRRRLIADVPLGAFLSGGVDSSTVCALVRRKIGIPLKTFSIGFEGTPESEHEVARAFATHIGTEHHDQILRPDVSEFLLGIGRVLDEPNADSSCLPTYLLSEFARRHVTVSVSGDGGDEMFLGYGRYFTTLDEEDAHARRGSSTWQPGSAYYSDRILISTERYVEELFGAVPEGLAAHLGTLRDELNRKSPALHARLRRTDVENYMPGAVLPKVDRMSMQHSLETRTPFLNVELARFAECLPREVLYRSGKGKVLLRELAYRYLPRDLVDLPKRGFGLPTARWGREEVLKCAAGLLEGEDCRLRACLGDVAVDRFLKRQRSPFGFSMYQVWALATLEAWARCHPARLPVLATRRKTHRAGRETAPAGADLVAWALSDREFAVYEVCDSELGMPPDSPGAVVPEEDRLLQLLMRVRQLRPDMEPPGPVLPWSGARRMPANAFRASARFKGATLYFPAADASKLLDAQVMRRLQNLRVAELVFFHPHRFDGCLLIIKLNHRGLIGRLTRWRSLRSAVVAKWRGRDCVREGPEGFVTPPLTSIPMEPAVELFDRYPVFHGGRQLVPVPVHHDDVAQSGGGRYSVWEGRCVFSALPPTWLGDRYWAVERSGATEPLLDYLPGVIEPPVKSISGYVETVRDWFARDSGSIPPPRLAPGDALAVLTHGLPPGGAERQWCYLAVGLQRLGYRVTFIVTDVLAGDNAHYLPFLKSHGIRVQSLRDVATSELVANLPFDPVARKLVVDPGNPFGKSLPQLITVLNALKPKVLYAQLDSSNLLSAVAGSIARVPRTVLSFRNYNPSNFAYLSNDWFLPMYRAVTGSERVLLSGNARASNADYASWIGIPESRVAWIPNVVDADLMTPPPADALDTVRRELGIDPATPVVLGVFRLSEEKKPLVFLEICRRLHGEFPNLKAFVVGIGAMRRDLEALRDEIGLNSVVTFLGRRDDVPALMCVSSLVLLASSFEGMPNVLMEAQALGTPVVATRVGGVPDCVRDGATGFIVEPGDEENLVRACRTLLADPVLARRMGDAGQRLMRDRYSIATLAERHLALIEGDTDSVAGRVEVARAGQ